MYCNCFQLGILILADKKAKILADNPSPRFIPIVAIIHSFS